jgi:spermidine synthase
MALCLAGPAAAGRLGLRATGFGGDTRREGVILGGVALAGALLLVFTRDFETRYPQRQVRRDYTATVVATGEGLQRLLVVNGVGMTTLTPITKMMAHLPLASLDRPPRDTLVVCMGMGTTFRSLLSWGVQATAVELVPSVPELFAYYHPDAPEVLSSGRGRIVVDDGRRFLDRSPEAYDVITIDPPPPVEAAGSSLLYSREFYAAAKRRLRPGGIVQQWVPYGDSVTLASATRALADSFPHVRVFGSLEGWGFHLLARQEPISSVTAAVLAGKLPPAAGVDLLEWTPGLTAAELFEAVLSQETPAGRLIALAPYAPSLTDDRPVNEYYFLRRTLASLAPATPR